jgi:hypothetical protein
MYLLFSKVYGHVSRSECSTKSQQQDSNKSSERQELFKYLATPNRLKIPFMKKLRAD